MQSCLKRCCHIAESLSSQRLRLLLTCAASALGIVCLPMCKTRELGAKLRSTEPKEFIHWDPTSKEMVNKSWPEERDDRQGRLNDLVAPDAPLQQVSQDGLQFFKPLNAVQDLATRLRNRFSEATLPEYRGARWGFQWYRDTPVGYSGIPLIIFRAILKDAESQSSPFFSIWNDLTWYGLTPHPTEFSESGEYDPKLPRRRVLPLGMGWTRSPLKTVELDNVLQMDTKEFKEVLTTKVQNFVQSKIQRAFISCGACHTGRVAIPDTQAQNGFRFQFLYGAPSTEYDQTAFGDAIARTLVVVQEAVKTQETKQAMVERLGAIIKKLNEGEKHFPYGNSIDEVVWSGMWQGNVPVAWAIKERELILQRLPEILDAMPAQLGLRNKIVGELQNSAYKGPNLRLKPEFNGESPGQLDAFGFGAAIVKVVKDLRKSGQFVDSRSQLSFADWLKQKTFDSQDFPFADRTEGTRGVNSRIERYFAELDASSDSESEPVVPKVAAKVDPASIWGEYAALRAHANWDGNQRSAGARALSTSLAIVANPAYVDVRGSEFVAKFMAYNPGQAEHGPDRKKLPTYPSAAPVYPAQFKVNQTLLAAGKALYQENCYTCHYPKNETIYPVDPGQEALKRDQLTQKTNKIDPGAEGWVGTDPNRSIQVSDATRSGLLALWNETCQGREWCASSDPAGTDGDVFRRRGASGQLTGYVAGVLDGVWARAPYLHNGSVPTMRALIVPSLRKTKVKCGNREFEGFWRGNILYDTKDLGFEWRFPPFASCDPNWDPFDQEGRRINFGSPFEGSRPLYPTASKSARIYEYGLEGNSNAGHDTAGYLGGVDWATETISVGGSDVLKADALIEYIKTL